MIIAFANAVNMNDKFSSAWNQMVPIRRQLSDQLASVEVDGKFNTVGFVIGDFPANYFRVNHRADETLFQVFVGYDASVKDASDVHSTIIHTIAGWLRRTFDGSEAYAPKRTQLASIVDDWERNALAAT